MWSASSWAAISNVRTAEQKGAAAPYCVRNVDAFYAELEQDLMTSINARHRPAGAGRDTTSALDVCIETAPCHIASLPVAVTIECHSHRHGKRGP
jgi:fumarate hydratase subunit alpha